MTASNPVTARLSSTSNIKSGSFWTSSIVTPSWLAVSPEAGTVTISPKTIDFTINSSARSLLPGAYVNSVNFYNTTNNQGNTTRVATLIINPKQYTVTVGASPAADGTVSGGGAFAEASSVTVT